MGFYNKKQNNGNKDIAESPAVNTDLPGISANQDINVLAPDDELTQRKYVINTMNNETGVNTGRLFDVVADLKGFGEGTATTVTYYKENYAETDVRGRQDDTEGGYLNTVHKSMLKINNFEIRLTGPLQYEHDTTETQSRLTGEALTYPGFQPEKGDRFVIEVDSGKCAIMTVVEAPTRMSIRASTYYKIQFSATDWASTDSIKVIEDSVTDEAWFDKKRFLNEPGALLYHDEYVEIQYLGKQRKRMLNYHLSNFLDKKIMYSFMRPDGIYDPYLVDFQLKCLEQRECGYRPVQLYRDAPYIDMSVWSAIFSADIPLEGVMTSNSQAMHVLGSKSVKHNALTNKYYVYWTQSTSLRDYFTAVLELEAKKYKLLEWSDLETTELYLPTRYIVFRPGVVYYTRSGTGTTEDPYVYTQATVKIGDMVEANKYYEKFIAKKFADGVKYFRFSDYSFFEVDTSKYPYGPVKNERYYVLNTGDTDDDSEGDDDLTIPSDDSVTEIAEDPDAKVERTIGDLLLHIHHHYCECPLTDCDCNQSCGSGGCLDYILNGSDEHIALMRLFLLTRKINLHWLHVCIEQVWKLPKIQQFYKMPIYMFLCSIALSYIHGMEGIRD